MALIGVVVCYISIFPIWFSFYAVLQVFLVSQRTAQQPYLTLKGVTQRKLIVAIQRTLKILSYVIRIFLAPVVAPCR